MCSTVDLIRARIAARPRRCDPACPGWEIFNEETRPAVQACDVCSRAMNDPLTDEEAALLPEAQEALARASGVTP